MSRVRYAIYYAPEPDEDLARFGSAVLGYDAARGEPLPHLVPRGFDAAQWAELTKEPRRYGFHATLKAPFRLSSDWNEAALLAAVTEFSSAQSPFSFDVRVEAIGNFVALVPTFVTEELTQLEREIVETFDKFRAPLTEDELVRRLATPLTPRQRASLDRYGYPYVHADFRFHMTLSGSLELESRNTAVRALSDDFRREVGNPRVYIRSIAIFRQDAPDGSFYIIARAPFGFA